MKNRIQELRKKHRLTQKELAKIAGVSRTYISNLESNRYRPGLLVAYYISQAFDLSIEDVFTLKGW